MTKLILILRHLYICKCQTDCKLLASTVRSLICGIFEKKNNSAAHFPHKLWHRWINPDKICLESDQVRAYAVFFFFSILFLDWMLHYISARTALIIIFISPCEHTVAAVEARTLLDPVHWVGDCCAPAQSDSHGHTLTTALIWVCFCLVSVFRAHFCICVRADLKLQTTT